MAGKRPPSVERKIYFFRCSLQGPSTVRIPFDPLPSLRAVKALPSPRDRYLQDGQGTDLLCAIDRIDLPSQVSWSKVRRSALPLVEEACIMTHLPIPPRAGLAETIHSVFFDGSILGVEFNFHGPRASAVATYLGVKTPTTAGGLRLSPILRGKAADILAGLTSITSLRLKIRSSGIAPVKREIRTLGEALESLHQVSGADVLTLEFKPTPYSRQSLGDSILGVVRKLMRISGNTDSITALEISGRASEDGPIQDINVLHDFLFVREEIVRQERSRAVQSSSAYQAIERAFRSNREEIMGNAELDT